MLKQVQHDGEVKINTILFFLTIYVMLKYHLGEMLCQNIQKNILKKLR